MKQDTCELRCSLPISGIPPSQASQYSCSDKARVFVASGMVGPCNLGSLVRYLVVIVVLPALLFLTSSSRAQELTVDSVHNGDPVYDYVPPRRVYARQLVPLWIRALKSPEPELQRLAADSIRKAHLDGLPGLDATAEELLNVLRESDIAAVRRAAAAALVTLNVSEASDTLVKRYRQGDFLVAQIAAPALAAWNHRPIVSVWLDHLNGGSVPSHGWTLLAIDGLGAAREVAARDALAAIVVDSGQSAQVRLRAASALARIDEFGLTEKAHKLAASTLMLDRLLAAAMLQQHTDEASRGILLELAEDEDPTVANEAAQRLFTVDPSLLYPLAGKASQRPDVNLRWVAARTLVHQGDASAIRSLMRLLNDHNPSLRRYIGSSLVELASRKELREFVVESTRTSLASTGWRGLEQSILVLATLQDHSSVGRFVKLARHERGEVYVAAAWALRRLAKPDLLPELLDVAQQQRHAYKNGQLAPVPAGEQAAQFSQAFAQLRYRPAHSYLRTFIPKGSGGGRGAAVWALGHLYREEAPEDLTRQLLERLRDFDNPDPETEYVRRMSAISLGRMKSSAVLPDLEELSELHGPNDQVGWACYWAIEQITGKTRPTVEPEIVFIDGWFLEPIDGVPLIPTEPTQP